MEFLWKLAVWCHFGVLSIISVDSPAIAQSSKNYVDYGGDIRIGFAGGAVIPNSINFNGIGVIQGIPASSSGRINLDAGPALGGFIGYTINNYMNIEAIVGYASANINSFDGRIKLSPLGTFNGKFPVSGDTQILAGFVNVMFDPFGIGTFTPYIGGGPGVAVPKATVRSIRLYDNFELPINSKSRETDFATNLLLGADIKVSEKWEAGLSYQFFWIDSSNLGSGAGLSGRSGNLSGHVFSAVFEYHL